MPLLFCLSLHRALVAGNARLQEGESLFAPCSMRSGRGVGLAGLRR